ncbi:uncharacterized protein LOC114301230 [Camellia sinensis]|uniref:uncharacterized protein LOC114301230 n=1 Tax=Camellia sinensis TaxID=4442 RepID=UPI001035CAEB|nr:uncharacterized protein LOC114301230 [Camellia sinensis]
MELCLNRKLLPLVQQELPIRNWFCCMDCSRIHSALQNLLVSGEEKLPESLLDVVKKKIEERGIKCTTDLDIRWRLLSGKMVSKETRPLLSKAVSIFHERVDPIEVSSTASIDLIPKMVYGRNVRDQEFGGIYCAILLVNSTIVSTRIIRIFGEEVAELPLVATSIDFQGQEKRERSRIWGIYCAIFSTIVFSGLFDFGEEVAELPLVATSIDFQDRFGGRVTYLLIVRNYYSFCRAISRFGFSKISEDELIKYRKQFYQMIVFEATSILQKPVCVLKSES